MLDVHTLSFMKHMVSLQSSQITTRCGHWFFMCCSSSNNSNFWSHPVFLHFTTTYWHCSRCCYIINMWPSMRKLVLSTQNTPLHIMVPSCLLFCSYVLNKICQFPMECCVYDEIFGTILNKGKTLLATI